MKGYLMVNKERLGEVDFTILDEHMGAIGGQLMPYPAYERYKEQIQNFTDSKGIANIHDFNFGITIGGITLRNIAGGIGVTD